MCESEPAPEFVLYDKKLFEISGYKGDNSYNIPNILVQQNKKENCFCNSSAIKRRIISLLKKEFQVILEFYRQNGMRRIKKGPQEYVKFRMMIKRSRLSFDYIFI